MAAITGSAPAPRRRPPGRRAARGAAPTAAPRRRTGAAGRVVAVLNLDRPGDGAVGVVGAVAARVRARRGATSSASRSWRRARASSPSLVTVRVDYRRWRRWPPAARASARSLLLVAVLVPGVGIDVQRRSRAGSASGPFRSSRRSSPSWRCCCSCADLLRPARAGVDATTRRGRCGRCSSVRRRRRRLLSCCSPTSARRSCSAPSSFAVLFVAGVPLLAAAPASSRVGRRRRSSALAHGRAATGGPGCWRSSTRGPTRCNTGYQIIQSLVGAGVGRAARRRARREPGQVGLPAQRPHRLHLRHHRRGARPRRRPARASACSSRFAVPRRAGRAAGARPLRHAAGRRHHRVVLVQAFVNIGGVVGLLPITGVPAAVRLLRRLRLLVTWPPPASSNIAATAGEDPARRGPDVFAVIAGGGTAGHVLPGVAEALVARGRGLKRCTSSAPSAGWRPAGARGGLRPTPAARAVASSGG